MAEDEQRAHSMNQDMGGEQELVSSSSGHESDIEGGDDAVGGQDPAAYRVDHQLRSLAH